MEFLSFDVARKTLDLKKSKDLPVPKQNEVRVRVAYAGICGTDLHILDVRRYHNGLNISSLLPMTQVSHELHVPLFTLENNSPFSSIDVSDWI